MSLVNDMLRDLDERKREGAMGYRAVAKRDSNTGRWVWISLFIVLVAIVIFFVAREWSGKINSRSNLLSLLDKEQVQTVNTSQLPLPEALIAQKTEVQNVIATATSKVKPVLEKTAPALTNISVITWTSQSGQRGTLTFWLDQMRPFVLYGRTTTTLDIAIDESRLAGVLPDINASLLSSIDIISEVGKSRFKLMTNGPVEFMPQLKQNPARLVVEVTSTEAKVAAPIATKSGADKETTEILETQEKISTVRELAPAVPKAEAIQSAGQWKKSLNTLPTDSSTVRNARRLLSQQRTDEALDLLKGYVNKAPSSFQSRYLLVQLYLATERYAAASEILHKAPDNLSWGLLKARAFLQQGQAKQAIQLLEQHPDGQNRQDYLDLLASGYQQTGQHAAAVARYLRLLALNSQEGRWWINLGVSLEHLGEKAKALDAYRSALQIPDLDQSLKQYAQLQSQRLMQSQ